MHATRFNLLLLEEGELFFEDYAAILYLPSTSGHNTRKQLSGRLKVGSKNLFFDSFSPKHPIMRIPYRDMQSLTMDKSKQHLTVISSQVVEMKKFAVVSPYLFREIANPQRHGIFVFEPSYCKLDDFVGLIAQIYQINKLKNTSISKEELSKLIKSRESKIEFDSSWIDITEKTQIPKPLIVSKLTPLVEMRGQIQISNKRIYFQPFANQSSNPMLKFDFKQIDCVYKRKYCQRDLALEFIVKKTNHAQKTLLLSFDSNSIRDYVYKILLHHVPNIKDTECSQKTLKYWQSQWTKGNVSNFDYLMFLNQQSGRSFNDLTQYPIFPWVIHDYESKEIDLNDPKIYRDLSKPIGALNPKRLKKILARYHEMPSDANNKFLYGSFYSCPAYVFYFLVRCYPEYMLKFQNGKFDSPDRLFSSMARTWDSCFHSLTDFKELIPQFYDGDGSFLLNTMNLNLGVRTDFKEVHNVELPQWANSPQHFVEIMRAALESKHCSSHLHEWIDLIWGYKQRGKEAEKALNVFYYLTYEGAVDIEAIDDKSQLEAILMQMKEFGQTPSRLFKTPHPSKFSNQTRSSDSPAPPSEPPPLPPSMSLHMGSQSLSSISKYDLQRLKIRKEEKNEEKTTHFEQPKSTTQNWKYLSDILLYDDVCKHSILPTDHAHRITDICISSDDNFALTVCHDSSLNVTSLKTSQIVSSTKISHLAISSISAFEAVPNLCVVGGWNNQIYLYNYANNKILQTLKSHKDSVQCLETNGLQMCSGSWDSTVKIWKYKNDSIYNEPILSYNLDAECRCIAVTNKKEVNLVIAGDENGSISMFDSRYNSKCVRSWAKVHNSEVTSLCWIPRSLQFLSSSSDCTMKRFDARNGKVISSAITRENMSTIKTDGHLIVSGGELGAIRLWNFNNDDQINEITRHCLVAPSPDGITAFDITKNGKYIVAGTKKYTNNVVSYNLENKKSKEKHQSNHHRNKSLPLKSKDIKNNNNKTYSFGSSAFAKLTASASNMFSFGSNEQN